MSWFSKSNPLAERAKSPFYGSFIISWLIWNWRIVLTVFLLKKEDLGALNVVDYIEEKYLKINDYLWIPLIFTAFFILILPWVDYLIIWYTEFNKRKKVEKTLEVGKKTIVSAEQYSALRQKYEEERNKIINIEKELNDAKAAVEDISSTVGAQKARIDDLAGEKQKAEENRIYVTEKLVKLENRRDLTKFFTGRWTRRFNDTPNNTDGEKEEEIEIRNNEYLSRKGMNMETVFELKLIDFDQDSKQFNFVKYKEKAPPIIVELRIINEDTLEGFESGNGRAQVIYKRSTLDLNKLSVK